MPISTNRTTLRDIAQATGVHVSTVSRVLNGDPRNDVAAETQRVVLAAAQELGYRPNLAARSLRLRRAGAIGLLIPDITHPTYAALTRGAFAEAEAAGVVVLVAEVPPTATGSTRTYRRLLDEHRIDGLLVASAIADPEVTADLDEAGLPVVFVNRRREGRPSVSVLDDAGAALAARTLLDRGHRDVAMITGLPTVETSHRRTEGFVSALKDAGAPDPMLVSGSYTAEGGAAAMTQILSSKPRPTAVFAANLMSGLGALSRAAAHGVQVPRHISLVVFDDAEIADLTVPPLTRIRMPFEELGATSVQTLARVLDGQEVGEVVVPTPPVLVEGQSLTPIALG